MFIEKDGFGFVSILEENWQTIREECLALPQDVFEPWVQREMYGEGWSVYGLYAFGSKIENALRQCPKTARLLAQIPRLTTAGFSKLAAHSHIKPHVGWVTTVYRAHLGLIVPENCALRVGEVVENWAEGKCLIFDDTVEHEAWNKSDQDRIVLLFDFARPEIENFQPDIPPAEVRKFIEKQLET